MGTVVSIDVRSPLAPPALDAALAAAAAALHRADADFSTFRPASWVSRLRRGEVTLRDCPDHVREIYRIAAECRARTGGWFDPAWRRDGTLDPTGLVKGWAAAVAAESLTAAGAPDHSVCAAGDVRVGGTAGPRPGQPWRIGIADPFDPTRLVAVATGTDLAVATSGVSQQGAHVVDPRTGVASDALVSVTVVGPDLTLADAYATAGLAAGAAAPELLAGLAAEGWSWLTVDAAGEVACSVTFPGRVRARAAGAGQE